LKDYWRGQRFRSGDEVEVAVQEYLPLQDPRFYHDGNFKLLPSLDRYIAVLRDGAEQKRYFIAVHKLPLMF
jgi:hypothetical protein